MLTIASRFSQGLIWHCLLAWAIIPLYIFRFYTTCAKGQWQTACAMSRRHSVRWQTWCAIGRHHSVQWETAVKNLLSLSSCICLNKDFSCLNMFQVLFSRYMNKTLWRAFSSCFWCFSFYFYPFPIHLCYTPCLSNEFSAIVQVLLAWNILRIIDGSFCARFVDIWVFFFFNNGFNHFFKCEFIYLTIGQNLRARSPTLFQWIGDLYDSI